MPASCWNTPKPERKGLIHIENLAEKHKRHLLALGMAVVMAVAFFLGWYAGINAADRNAYAALWEAITGLPDPEQCALCGEERQYHAPCLINLSTGQMGEMQVYTYGPTGQGRLDPREAELSGTLSFQRCAGLTAIRDNGFHTCQVTLPEERELMNPALFCRDCRLFLAGAGLEGYTILDLYDPDYIQAYPIRDGTIRDYRISMDNCKGGETELCVTGLL